MSTERKLTLNARWDNSLVPAGERCQRSLLIEVTAPPKPQPQKERPPINLALVIDRSGSMAGGSTGRRGIDSPMEAAKQAATGIAQGLTEKDRLSVVIFDNEVETLFDGLAMDAAGKQHAEAMIRAVHSRGMTNMSGGWFEGARCAARMCEQFEFAEGHVLVLSDGHANEGICSPEELTKHAVELAARGIKTSAVGIGNNYSPLQLDALAEGGQGRLHDAETTEDIIDVVLGELGELHAITARDVRLTLRYPSLARLDLLTRSSFEESVGQYVVRLGDIVGDASRPVAVRVELPRLEQGEKLAFDISASWKQQAEDAGRLAVDCHTALSVVPPHEAAANTVDIEVVEQVADLWEARLAYQAMRHNERGDFVAACASYDAAHPAFDELSSQLADAPARMSRISVAREKVSRQWEGRSKREAYAMSKKAMLRERDLRRGDRGEWHDKLDE